MLLLQLNCFAQSNTNTITDLYSLNRDERYMDSVNKEYNKRWVVFNDSVNNEWEKNVKRIKNSPYFSEQQKTDFTSKAKEEEFHKACWACGKNCCGEYFFPPNVSRPRYINDQQKMKPVEVPAYTPK